MSPDPEKVDLNQISGKYNKYIVGVFQLKREQGYERMEDIPFDKDDIEEVRRRFDLDRIKNVPDLKYNLRSRAQLPDVLREIGYEAVIQNDAAKRKDAAYLLTTESDTLVLDTPDETHSISDREVPKIVREYISTDEQGTLTRVRYADVLSQFTGLDCYHLQSHLRTAGESGQVEIDDLYVGQDDSGEHYTVVVEGKGGDEKFSRNQIQRNTTALREKTGYPSKTRSLGVKSESESSFRVVEFSAPERTGSEVTINRDWRYQLVDPNQTPLDEY